MALSDSILKREVYRSCDSFSIDSLRIFCGAFESTKRVQSYTSGVDFGYGSAALVAAAASGTNTLLSADDDDVTDTAATAAATGPARPRPHQQHQPERNSNRTNIEIMTSYL